MSIRDIIVDHSLREKMHGNGVFWFTMGDVYLGQFLHGHLHGLGMMSVRMENDETHILKGFFHWNEFVGSTPL